MPRMTPLVESLLAYTDPYGGKVCRLGTVQIIIPVLPPGATVVLQSAPFFNAYMNIDFSHILSPDVVPGTIDWVGYQRGMERQARTLGTLSAQESESAWIEYTIADPLVIEVTNTSPLNQYFEALDLFLIVDTKTNLAAIRDIVAKHQGRK